MTIKSLGAIALAGVLALSVAGCNTTGIGTTISTAVTNTESIYSQIVTGTQSACKFIPDTASINGLIGVAFSKGVPGLDIATSVVSTICGLADAAKTKLSVSRFGASSTKVVGTVDNIVVKGHFVK